MRLIVKNYFTLMKQPKIVESGRFELSEIDWQKWLKNTAIFLAPAMLMFLVSIESGKSVEESLLAIKVWGLNCAIDIVRKFIKDNTK